MGVQLLGAYLNGFQGAVRVATVRFRLKAPHGTPMDGQVKLGSYIHITLVYLFGF